MLFGRARQLTPALILVPVILCARFIDNNIEHGQINLPTLALTVWAIVVGEEERPIASGAMLAVAILIKPFAGLAALFLLLEGKWRSILVSIACGLLLMFAPTLVFGPRGALDQTVAYLQVVSSMTDRYTTMLTNQSATSAIARADEPRCKSGRACIACFALYRDRNRAGPRRRRRDLVFSTARFRRAGFAAPSIPARRVVLHYAVAGPDLMEELLRRPARSLHAANFCDVERTSQRSSTAHAHDGSGSGFSASQLDSRHAPQSLCAVLFRALPILAGVARGDRDHLATVA